MHQTPDLKERLDIERRALDRLRDDYAVVSKSRFFALRMLWFSFKALLGRSGPKDIYACWSPMLVPGGGLSPLPASRNDAKAPALESAALSNVARDEALDGSASQLIARWRAYGQTGPCAVDPVVTVVVPVYNNCDFTIRCLQSMIDQWPQTLPTQLVVVDDGSSDSTSDILPKLAGIDYVRNGVNSGFIRSCNRGAAIARGRFICFLNNDTIVTPGWLDELTITAERDATVGAVGSKLVYPDGRLQEAGGLLWRDATGWNYGRGGDPEDPKYNYVRDVDYCSGAALLVRADLFRRLGGFSEEYAPAYYEDADLCFALRKLGFRVVFQPRSVVVHDEGVSSGVSIESGVKSYQAVNHPKFLEKWREELQANLEHDPQNSLLAARRLGRSKTILMVDSYVPEYDKDAGSLRLFKLIQLFQDIGFDVVFVPDNYFRSEPYTSILQKIGVEVVYGNESSCDIFTAVRERLAVADVLWVARPELGARWLPIFRERPDIPVVYDTLDLHYVREKRELNLRQITDSKAWKKWEESRDYELGLMRISDVTVALTDVEQETLASEGINRTFVIPTIHELSERKRSYRETDGVLFIGGYQHPPNVDAVLWLCNEIMPLVWEMHPQVKVTLLGSNPPAAVKALQSERISVPGYLSDVGPYFESARVFVAPLRFGAGHKGKIGQAFGYKLPIITTAVGAEGFGIIDGEDAIIADDPHTFSEAILRVYGDEALWTRLSEGAVRRLEHCSPQTIKGRLEEIVEFVTGQACAPA